MGKMHHAPNEPAKAIPLAEASRDPVAHEPAKAIPLAEASRDPVAHEQACLAAVVAAAERDLLGLQDSSGKRLTDIRLVGAYPETQLRIKLHYRPERGGERELAYNLWKRLFVHPIPDDHVPSPELFASDVLIWALES